MQCGECETRCPYQLPIREMITERAPTVVMKQKAIELGVAQRKLEPAKAFEIAETIIKRARAEMDMRQEKGFIKMP
mgnify:CR=1 FL=1